MRKRVLENPITFRPRRCRFCGRPGAWIVPELGQGFAHPECWKKSGEAGGRQPAQVKESEIELEYYCPRCASPRARAEVEQAERDEVCVYVCVVCREIVLEQMTETEEQAFLQQKMDLTGQLRKDMERGEGPDPFVWYGPGDPPDAPGVNVTPWYGYEESLLTKESKVMTEADENDQEK